MPLWWRRLSEASSAGWRFPAPCTSEPCALVYLICRQLGKKLGTEYLFFEVGVSAGSLECALGLSVGEGEIGISFLVQLGLA